MGLQPVGEKKRRLAERETGLSLARVCVASNSTWLGVVDTGDSHWHVAIDKRTWEVRSDSGSCWTTCRERGPRVTLDLPGDTAYFKARADAIREKEAAIENIMAMAQDWADRMGVELRLPEGARVEANMDPIV